MCLVVCFVARTRDFVTHEVGHRETLYRVSWYNCLLPYLEAPLCLRGTISRPYRIVARNIEPSSESVCCDQDIPIDVSCGIDRDLTRLEKETSSLERPPIANITPKASNSSVLSREAVAVYVVFLVLSFSLFFPVALSLYSSPLPVSSPPLPLILPFCFLSSCVSPEANTQVYGSCQWPRTERAHETRKRIYCRALWPLFGFAIVFWLLTTSTNLFTNVSQ